MAQVSVIEQSFEGEDGKPVKYKRLAITGIIDGELHTLELKLSKSELLLAEILLSSKEERPTTQTRKATAEEAAGVAIAKTPVESQSDSGEAKSWLDEED